MGNNICIECFKNKAIKGSAKCGSCNSYLGLEYTFVIYEKIVKFCEPFIFKVVPLATALCCIKLVDASNLMDICISGIIGASIGFLISCIFPLALYLIIIFLMLITGYFFLMLLMRILMGG
jgi:hypothetical protein